VPKDYQDRGEIRVPTDRNALQQFLATVHQKEEGAQQPNAMEKGSLLREDTPPVRRARPSKKGAKKTPANGSES